MRPIDGDKLYAVLDNIAEHLFENNSEPQNSMAQTIQYVMGIVRDQPDIMPTPNDPLTLEKLREICGEPVWISTRKLSEWCIVHSFHSDDVIGGGIIVTRRTAEKRTYQYVDYGKTWLAYRRKPEEGTA